MKNELKVFENNNIRSIYNEEQEKWYFSVEDIVRILTDSVNPKDYIKKLRKRDTELSEGWGQIVTPLKMETPGTGKALAVFKKLIAQTLRGFSGLSNQFLLKRLNQ